MRVFTNSQGFHCQMLAPGMPFSLSLPIDQCVVPQGLNGAVAVWVTSDDQALNGGVIDRQSNAIVAGPLLTFIDIEVDEIAVVIRKKGSSGSGSSPPSNSGTVSSFVSTSTVSPSAAAGIIGSNSVSPLSPSATPSATASSSPAPNNVIANGVSMIPKPTSSS